MNRIMANIELNICKVLLVTWLFCATGSLAQILEKGCRMSQLDSKFKPITNLARNVWPQTENGVNELCSSYPKHLSETRLFIRKCAKGEAKTVLSVSTHSTEKMTVKLYCKGKNVRTERTKLMETGKCVNTGAKTGAKCWTTLINSITVAANASQNKDRIPLLCCSLNRWKDCFVKVYEDMGSPVCKPENIEYMDQFLYKSMIDPLNIFCSEYEDSDKCNQFKDFFSKSLTMKAKYVTPFPAILTLFGSL